jgi:hypothetical protein
MNIGEAFILAWVVSLWGIFACNYVAGVSGSESFSGREAERIHAGRERPDND